MPKIKLSITLSTDLVNRIDAEAQRAGGRSRSAVIESWLRRGARVRAEHALRDETIAYYERRTGEQAAEDEALARSSGRRARELDYDD